MFPKYNDYVAEEYKRFFLSTFVMLGFNRIGGDCIEFGCCGAVTHITPVGITGRLVDTCGHVTPFGACLRPHRNSMSTHYGQVAISP
jgi:hypothetical protein